MDTALTANRTPSFYVKRVSGVILLLALAAVFFYSAYSKSGIRFDAKVGFPWVGSNDNAFDSFQWTFLDMGISSIIATGVIARLMIGFELLLGLFLVCHIYLRAFTYKAIIVVLTIFIAYLLIIIIKQGNSGNCGCFGNSISMTPLNAIWKNLAMIAATLVLWKIYPVKPYKHQEYIGLVVAAVAFSTPFLVNRMFISTAPDKPKTVTTINLDPLYKYPPAPSVDLRKGKHIIAFMSLTCPHCKKAAYLLQIIHHEHPDIPMFLVLDGPDTYLKKFFDETHAENVPNLYFRHVDEFTKMAGSSVPSILWVNDGNVEYKSTWACYQLDPGFMEQWLRNK